MSAPFDALAVPKLHANGIGVRAVLEMHANGIGNGRDEGLTLTSHACEKVGRELAEVHAAVASLIEAHKELLRVAKSTAIYTLVEGSDEEVEELKRVLEASAAALARAGGAS